MEITGKIIAVLPKQSGVSKKTGQPWESQEFVIETHEQYQKKCVFRVFGTEKLKNFNIQPNGEYTVSIDVDAHEFGGKWFNEVNAWKVAPATAQQPTQQVPTQQAAPTAPMQSDLPF